MSKYGWENGEIKLPSSKFSGFKKSFLDAVLIKANIEFLNYAKIFDTMKSQKITPKNRVQFLEHMLDSREFSCLDPRALFDISTKSGSPGKSDKAVKISLKQFFICAGISKQGISTSGYSIIFDSANKSVKWIVPENNHAVEDARSTYPAKVLFDNLRKVKWTKASGGSIIGNNEYNEDGSGNLASPYVVANYG